VDILLDAASSAQVVIEREGVSVTHPSNFIIVGSMNPEEGELRPQILDRIALQTEVVGIHDIESRMDIIRRRDDFTKDATSLRARFEPEQEALRKKIEEARRILPSVTTPERMLTLIARLCVDFDVDGHRADIIIERASRANAAFEGRLEVTGEDVVSGAEMALPHRMRQRPYAEERFDTEVLRKWVKKIEAEV
ncbi:MAG: magnesium chelatase, partial [Candidatus Thermoplasmatota archaeon]|nr:magnesium chelatase [Candidatus Thermoplasmatota archaeon]